MIVLISARVFRRDALPSLNVARRSLAFYQAIGEHLAGGIGGRS